MVIGRVLALEEEPWCLEEELWCLEEVRVCWM